MKRVRNAFVVLGLVMAATVAPSHSAVAASATELTTDGNAALERLYASSERARRYSRDAKAILVFPRIVKAGLVVGGQSGEGVLFVDGQPAGYFRISAASFGLQAGAQTFGYAMFLMNDSAVNYLKANDGWTIGTGPSVVVVDVGAATAANSATLREDILAFPFDQQGLMAGVDIEGAKISKIDR
jgi:lipid-binding SYLF domain-containing protein